MPELPDVEGFRRYFARHAAGRRISSIAVADRAMLRNTSPQGLGRALSGRRFSKPQRHGKWLIAPTGGPQALLHFGMTGLLAWSSRGGRAHPHDRVLFELDGGTLAYRNMRRLCGIWLAGSQGARGEIIGALGPDALAVGEPDLAELLRRRRGQIKSALMDQRLIAGLGNLLTDEILWRARINPKRPAASLGPRRVARLHDCMTKVLRDSNRHGRVPGEPGWLTGVRAEREPRCPRCGAGLRRGTVAGRTAVWCPRCQPR